MVKHDQPGPMYARYASDPSRTAPAQTRVEIGFVAAGGHTPEPPFRAAQRDAEFVAYTAVVDRVASPRTDYRPILEWVQANGHAPLGPIVEVYDPPGFDATRTGQRTEIRVVLKPPSDAAPIARSGEPKPGPDRLEATMTSDRRQSETGQTGFREPRTESTVQPADATAGSPGSNDPPSSTSGEMDAVAPASNCDPTREVAGFIEAEQFDCVALALMPDDRVIPVEHQVWFGQVIFRVRAVAKGIQQRAQGRETTALALANAVDERYREVSATFAVNPLDHVAAAGGSPASDNVSAQKRRIMRSLDALMAKIALAITDGPTATSELVRILQSTSNTLTRINIEQNATSDRP
jgi:hypothetical protein